MVVVSGKCTPHTQAEHPRSAMVLMQSFHGQKRLFGPLASEPPGLLVKNAGSWALIRSCLWGWRPGTCMLAKPPEESATCSCLRIQAWSRLETAHHQGGLKRALKGTPSVGGGSSHTGRRAEGGGNVVVGVQW